MAIVICRIIWALEAISEFVLRIEAEVENVSETVVLDLEVKVF